MALTIWQSHLSPRRPDSLSGIFSDFWLRRPVSLDREESREPTWVPAVDVRETDEAIEILAAVPGYRGEDLDVSYEDGVLSLTGERTDKPDSGESDEGEYLRREQVQGRFYRRIRLPVRTTTENAHARYENGVLTIRVPKAPDARGTTIKVETA